MKRIYLITAVLGLLSASMGCKKSSGLDGSTPTDGGTTTPPVTVVNGKALPAGATDGATFINSGTSVILDLYAPGKTSVSVIGEFNNWTPTVMNETPDGNNWWVQIDNITA